MEIRNYADVKVLIETKDILKTNVIYRLTFPNGKFYIGQTIQKLRVRLSGHCNKAFNIKSDIFNTAIARAIRKYLTFTVDILYQGDNLDEEEIKFIEMHNATDQEYGYNTTLGGQGHKGNIITDEHMEKLKQINSERLTGKFGKDSIRAIPILQFSKDMNFIKEFGSITDAAEETKIGRTAINNNLKGLSKTSGGYIWKYKNKN